MEYYRAGDEVMFETVAIVLSSEGGIVRIRTGDMEFDATHNNVFMIRKSFHKDDNVTYQGRKAVIEQLLSEGAYLIKIAGLIGAQAYKVVEMGDIVHDKDSAPAEAEAPGHADLGKLEEEPSENQIVEQEWPEPEPAKPEPVEPEPVAPAAATEPRAADQASEVVADDHVDAVEHEDLIAPQAAPAPVTAADKEDHSEPHAQEHVFEVAEAAKVPDREPLELTNALPAEKDPSETISAMAATLSGAMVRKPAERRAALNLDEIGETQTVKPIATAVPTDVTDQ